MQPKSMQIELENTSSVIQDLLRPTSLITELMRLYRESLHTKLTFISQMKVKKVSKVKKNNEKKLKKYLKNTDKVSVYIKQHSSDRK